ncbi:hypothetical protein E2P81_ATG05447 [Venturia nashicola]|uniref:Uncharacterized protein n=1 Tax=Venturia nashicola TaxID=86259 RepID=A0A4Z1NXY4_9PEZI|nr:hypothetical protein E6O75_ATG05582 [Venturia nashicola]TLD32471.1 hypothetical protein E2P81_ATG05447 [Venturia nashicola]
MGPPPFPQSSHHIDASSLVFLSHHQDIAAPLGLRQAREYLHSLMFSNASVVFWRQPRESGQRYSARGRRLGEQNDCPPI